MRYTAQATLSGDTIALRLAQIRKWLDARELDPSAFKYRMSGDSVRLRIAFDRIGDATAFAAAFGGIVLGVVAEVDAAD
jgi:hypothetical protein